MRTCIAVAILGTALLSAACGAATDASEATEHTAQTGSAIIAGTASGAADDAVVAIGIHNNEGAYAALCSGVLVAPNLVLTARHCVSTVQEASMMCDAQGHNLQNGGILADHPASELHIYVGQAAGATARSETANQTPKETAHGAVVITDGAKEMCNHDVGLIVLDHDVAGTYAPIHFDGPAVNAINPIVGYGLTKAGTVPSHRETVNVEVLDLGPWTAPSDDDAGPAWGIGDGELIVSEGACNGDSGGPMFDANHGVLAVASRVGGGNGTGPAGGCYGTGASGVYASLGPKRALIEQAFTAAGKPMWLEGQPNPFTTVAPAAAPPTEDSTPVTDSTPAAASTETTSGCSTSSRGAGSSAWAFVVAIGLALASRRRR